MRGSGHPGDSTDEASIRPFYFPEIVLAGKRSPNSAVDAKATRHLPRREVVLFSLCLTVLTAVSLWPLWANRFLPMQDYPQHLFLAHVITTYDNPLFNWKEFYRVDLGVHPYMLWYLAMNMLGRVVDIEIAGKILFSLYILLITLLALVARRLAPKDHLPWGALLLYPFAFNQMYYLGFSNYIISLPLLFLAVLDLDYPAQGITAGRIARHGVYCLLLFLNHPYTVLVYIALTATTALCSWGNRAEFLRRLLPAGAMCLIFTVWYLIQHGSGSAPTTLPWSISWWPFNGTVAYYLLQFTGMRLTEGPDWLTVGLWGSIALLFMLWWQRRENGNESWRRLAALYCVSLAGFLVLPFWMGYYSYFNLRLAPVSYFALSLLLCKVRITSRSGMVLALPVLALLVISIQTQKAVVRETETILPVVSAAKKNSLILPLMFNSAAAAIDPIFFYQLHAHEGDYYHLLVGGGANPTLFPNAMMPVQYQPDLRLPYPERAESFTWRDHGRYYDYLLVRQAPPELYRSLALTCTLVATSGPWRLFQNKVGHEPL